jgi:hypothetical protein
MIHVKSNPECQRTGHLLQILKVYEPGIVLAVCNRCNVLFGVNDKIRLLLPVGLRVEMEEA